MRPEKCGFAGNMFGWLSRLQVASKVTRYCAVGDGLGGAVVVVTTDGVVPALSDPLHPDTRNEAKAKHNNPDARKRIRFCIFIPN